MEINQAIDWTVRLIAVCILIDTLEKFLNYREFRGKGVFSWDWVRRFEGFSKRRRIIRGFADAVFGNFRVWFSLLALRGLAALGLLLAGGRSPVSTVGLLILFAVGSLENFRRMPFYPETPNRFTLIIIGALFLHGVVPTETVALACLWFIALQSCLAYATAGFTKLFNKDWLEGNGVFYAVNAPHITATPVAARFLWRNPLAGKALNYLTIAIECAFPLVLLVGKPFFTVFLIWGVLFHLTNAYLLRLNNYFWPWIATYPAIIYLAQS